MIDEMVSAIAKLQRKPASTVIISSLETLASSIKEGWPLVQESMDSYSTLFQKSIRNLGRMTISREDLVVHMPTTNTQDIDKWLRQQANELEAYKECEEALVNYQDCTTKMKNHGIPENWEGPFEGLSSLTAWLNSSIEAGEKQWREQEIIECFKHHCSEASLNLNWNPFSDDVIKRDEWASLCSSLQKQIVTPYLLGVALRVLLDTKSTEYVHLVGDILENWREDFVRTSKILSVLSSIQIERLWDDDVQVRPALVLCILNSWLNACDNNDQSGIDYWYQKPLKVVSAKSGGRHVHVSGSVYKFLHELKVLVRQGDICSSGRWQRIIADVGDGAARAHADYLYDQMKQRVLVPPNYGGNYGYIAVNIYEELFLPLHEAVLARNMDGVRSQLSELRTKFDFGKWFARNSGQYQRHGHIASEHKKKIQYYIDDRLNCIDEWLDAEYDTTSERGDQIRNVQSAVDKLLAEYEQQGSQTPDEYLATIGWWVNELRRDGAVPVPSAGNSTGVLSGMSVPSILINEHEFPWRCIEAQVTGLTPKWEAYAADALSIWSHPDVETSVLQHWRDEDRIECIRSYVQRSERGGNVVSREMKQWLTEREEELKGFLILDIKEIQSKMEGFQSDIKQLYQEELDDIKQHFNSGNWYDLRTRTKSLKEAVCSALDSYGNDEKRQQLCDDITYLGGTACNESELVELETELNKLLSAAEDRMVHIKVLGNLLQLPELPENLRDEIADIIQMLKQPRYLPTADRADWLKCILETAFSLLTEHLATPGILLPEYRNLLLQLLRGLTQLLSNQEWILQQDSEAEKLLLQVSDRLDEEHSIDSVQSIKQFLAWLSEQSEGFNFPTFDIDSDVPRNEYGVQEDDTVMPPGIDDDVSSEKAKRTLTEALLRFSDGLADIPASEGDDEEIGLALSRKSWDEVARLCVARARLEKEKQFSDIFFVSAGLSLAYVLTSKDRSDVVEALLFLVDHIGTNGLPKTLTKKTQRTEKPPLGVVAASWLIGQDVDNVSTWRHDDEVIGLAAVRLARVLKVNSNDVSGKFSSPVLDALWDYALGETWGADFRACLLHICTRGGLLGALVFLLKKDPVKMQEQRAKLFAGLVGRATDVPGWERLTGFLESERNKQRSKPFALFAEQLLALSKRRKENPATIEVVGPVEKGQEKNVWIAVIQVVPSVLDPPQDIVLRVPKNSPVTFGTERRLTQYIEGPFLDRQQIRIALNFKETFRSKIPVEVQCRIKTLQDVQTDFMLTWTIDTEKTEDNFVALDPSSIEQCFNRFPYSPMRGKDYVPRDADEKTIEEMLFNSQQAGSLWITSPRRSGKTTMLFRILDEFSYKKGRDDIILYFTLDSPIESKKAFNSWIWRRILKARENRELKNYIPNLKEIGTTLDMDDDVDIFLSDIAEGLLKNVLPGARVYFVIDEIDRFAEMFLTGGAKRDMALSIMWQLRNLISSETTVGILFAGSHAARRFFVSDSSAPFYNSIAAINLEPFNVDTQQRESRTRAIVQPKNLADVFTVSKDTLRHLLRITAGIPYYMKLLAGATFTCAKHSQILPADVNEGVTRMLAKKRVSEQ